MRRVLSCTVITALAALTVPAPTHALVPVLNPVTLAATVNYSPSCLDFSIAGVCLCKGVPCGVRITHYVPTAFVETTPALGDTLLATPSFGTPALIAGSGVALATVGPTGQSHQSGTDNSFEAHVWSLPQSLLNLRSLGLHCLVCNQRDAQSVPLLPPIPSYQDTLCSPFTGAAAHALDGLNRQLGGAGFGSSLYYASELDFVNWRTGCRDLSITKLLKANAFTCALASLPGMDRLQRLVGLDVCVGRWGPLYPRQMRELGNTAVAASAKTAYRALSVARTQGLTFPFPVDLNSKLQQNFPMVSACMRPGTLPVPLSALTSPTGAYGWIYWRRVSCCVGFDSLRRCAKS